MRLPFKDDNYFSTQINGAFSKLESSYLEAIKPIVEMKKVNAMLGDGTVTQVNTFDPQKVGTFFQEFIGSAKGWLTAGVSKSTTEDLHRLFFQISKDIDKYHLLGYFGIQFHALPYYRVDKKVIEVQKELNFLAEKASEAFMDLSTRADKVIESKLEQKGLSNLEFQDLFTQMFEDDALVQELDKAASSVEKEFPQVEDMHARKNQLFGELNDLLIEMYQTTAVSIDYNRLMQGEEGVVTYFDIETIKSKKTKVTDAYVNTERVTKASTDRIVQEFLSLNKSMDRIAEKNRKKE